MSVHYKFKSALSFDTITFDGLHISIRDLKKAILQQKQIGKASDFDLQITNAQSNEVYEDDNTLVPKNSSLIVVRIPLTTQQKKAWEKSDALPVLGNKGVGDLQDPYVNKLAKTVDLANVEASEADKIQAAITQSTLDYDPSNYLRIKGSNQVGELPATYRCFKCNLPGHWIKDCKSSNASPDTNAADVKKSTGIPQSFMVPVEGPGVPGAMMTPTGHYAVPSIEHQARKEPLRKVTDPVPIEKPAIPDDLICGVCKDLLADAVLIPCCGNSFCDECIRNVLLESEDHQCPDCREKDVSPDTLIPNRFLRNSVSNFRNQTGYCRTAPSFLQSKMAAAAAAAAASHAHHGDPSLSHGSVDDHNSMQHSHHPPRISPVDSAKDARPPPRKERHSPDDVQIVDETPPISVAPISTISLDDPPTIAPPGESSVGQPILNIGTSKPVKHYDIDDNYHNRGFKPHSFRIRHERSDSPTVDERSHSVEPFQALPIESIGQPALGQPPRMFLHNQRPPPNHMYPQGNYMYRPNFPHPPPRHDLSGTYPPGVDHHPPPRMNINYRGNSYYPPRAPRAPYRPPHSSNGPHISSAPIDDPLEVFNRLLREKDLGRARDRRPPRRRSPSFGRSYSRSPSPRPRSRPPRSRSRSSTRLRSRTPRSRSPPPRSRSRSNVRRRSRSRSFSISSRSRSPIPPRSRSPRSMRSYHSRSPSRDRDRHYSPPPPGPRGLRRDDRRPERERSPRHSPVRYYSQRYKDEYGGAPPPKNDRGDPRPIERLDRDRDRDRDRERGRRFTKPSSVVQEYYSSSSQDFTRHGPDRYESKDSRESRYLDRPRERERDFEKDRDRSTFKRDRIPSLLDDPVAPPRRNYDRETYDRIASDWEKTRDRELQLQERERERQASIATSNAPPTSEFYHPEKHGHTKKREPVRPVEPILGVPRSEPPMVHHDDRERDLTYVQARDSPQTTVTLVNNKSPEKEKKSKEKKKKKSKEDSDKKKKKKKVKEKGDKKDGSEHEVSSSIPAVEEGEDESKQSEDVAVREDPLYGDLATNSDIVDIAVVETYTKAPGEEVKKELVKEKDVVLAPVPELSKWEKEDEPLSQSEERAQENGSESKQVTSEVIKRAENAIFKKSINPIHDKKSERRAEVKKSSKEKEKPPVKEAQPVTKEVTKEEKVKEEKVVVEPPEKVKEKDVPKAVHTEKEISPPRRERPDRRDDRERRDDRDRYRERREQEREREERYRLKMIEREREKDRHLSSSRDLERERHLSSSRDPERERHLSSTRDQNRDRYALSSKGDFDRAKISSERKVSDTIPLRISAKDRLGAKVDEKVPVIKKRLERREVKTEKVSSKRKERLDDRDEMFIEKKKHIDDDRFVTSFDKSDADRKKEAPSKDLEVVIISQNVAVDPPGVLPKKRSVSLDAERLVKKIKIAQGEGSTADSSGSSDESVSVKKHKKKKKKKHKKKKKKKKHSSTDSDSSSSSSDSETEKKRKHKKNKKAKKRKKSKK